MEKTFRRIAYFFMAIGAAIVGGAGCWASRTTSFIESASMASGTVVDLELSYSGGSNTRDSRTYYPVVRFRTPAGREHVFRSASGSNPPGYYVGERVEVLYASQGPADARIRSFASLWGGPVVVGGIGTAFLLFGVGATLAHRVSRKRAQELRRRGTPVQTTFQNVEQNTSLNVNGRSPWRIVTQWADPSTGLLHLFKSENIWFDPTPHLQGREITVYVDRRNPKRYLMDISFLPKLAT